MDAEFSAKARTQMLTDGTTAVVAIIQDSKIYVGNGEYRLLFINFFFFYLAWVT